MKKGCASSSCGTPSQGLDARTASRVAQHPCYSEEAHHHFARMHVAVAPRCNLQCHYCNRKFDCANESRPGVVSELLTPDEAVAKVKWVASRIPQLSVVGIAGPGDPLANPERTFETLERVGREVPDVKLCLSTNGLALPSYVERIRALNVEHVTITMNAVDPLVSESIYDWAVLGKKAYRGLDAAKLLLDRQLEGLQALIKADVLVKVNSILIPGVNDGHLAEVNRTIKNMGAFLHNIMPLISKAEHGTHYGLTGQRGPTPMELKDVQDQLEGGAKLMRHCRQCRADAVGLLGQDRGQEFTKAALAALSQPENPPQAARTASYSQEDRQLVRDAIAGVIQERRREETVNTLSRPAGPAGPPMLVAVASKGGGWVNQHFGHAREFMIYECDGVQARFVGHRKLDDAYCQGGWGEEEQLEPLLALVRDCQGVLVSKIGKCPKEELSRSGVVVVETRDRIETAVMAFYGSAQPSRQAQTA